MITTEEQTRPLGRGHQVLDLVLAKMEGAGLIAPGSRGEMLRKTLEDHYRSPAQAVARLFDTLGGIGGRRFHGPAWKKGQEVNLDLVLASLPIQEHARKTLAASLALDANSLGDVEAELVDARALAKRSGDSFDAAAFEANALRAVGGRIAQLVLDHLERRENRDAWSPDARPAISHAEANAEAAFRAHGNDLASDVDFSALAQEYAPTIGYLEPHESRKFVGSLLANRLCARRLTPDGEPIEINYTDDLYRPSDAEAETMQFYQDEQKALGGYSGRM